MKGIGQKLGVFITENLQEIRFDLKRQQDKLYSLSDCPKQIAALGE